jgi:LPPG:FO 2-phospho-L-lactate transferase
LVRSKLIREGRTLTEATAEIVNRFGIAARILPMTDARVETRVATPVGELSFEEYFVQRWYQDPVKSVRFAGAAEAKPAPGVLDAIMSASAVLIAPSNPVTSLGPILAIPGVVDALKQTQAPVAAVSPIIGASAVSGPAGILMAAQQLPVSITGVANAYKDFLDILIVDHQDAIAAKELQRAGLRVHCAQTIMRTMQDKAELARDVLSLVANKEEVQAVSDRS